MEYKQVILIRQDLKMPKGKIASQVAHASVAAVLKSKEDIVRKWKNQGMKKIVLKIKDKNEILDYENMARKGKLVTALITDAGRTVVEPGTITALAIGPDEEEKIDIITGKLKML